MIGRGRVAKTRANEMDTLLRLKPKGAGDALLLLTKLRIEHAARCRRRETFALCIKSMVRDRMLSGWTRSRYENARDLLMEARLLKRISEMKNTSEGREAAQYSL
jgi:hypothetical protein